MKAKQYLSRIQEIDELITEKLDDIYRLKQSTTSKSIGLKDIDVQSSGSKDRVADAVARIVDLEEEVNKLTDELYDLKQTVYARMAHLSKREYYEVLKARYIDYKPIYQIAIDMQEDYGKMKYIHRRALKEFDKTLNID